MESVYDVTWGRRYQLVDANRELTEEQRTLKKRQWINSERVIRYSLTPGQEFLVSRGDEYQRAVPPTFKPLVAL
jgi:hypothetical protein